VGSHKKKRQTIAKRNREREVEMKRTLKRQAKQAKREAARNGEEPMFGGEEPPMYGESPFADEAAPNPSAAELAQPDGD
jgi:hypothetical protein